MVETLIARVDVCADFKKNKKCQLRKSTLKSKVSPAVDYAWEKVPHVGSSALTVQRDDGLPQWVCCPCVNQLDRFSRFASICRRADKQLRLVCPQQPPESDNLVEITVKEEPGSERVNYQSGDDIHDDYGFDLSSVKEEDFKTDVIKEEKPKRTKKRLRKEKKSVLCPICGELFTQTSRYTHHMRKHMDDRRYPCQYCGKRFLNSSKRKEHEYIHTNERNVPCDICGKMFLTKDSRNKHNRNVHLKMNKIKCTVCGKTLSNTHSLSIHMMTHTGERNFQCDECGKKFSSRCTIISHLRVHSGEKPFACKFCPSKFAHSRSLTDHERLHKGETPHKCPECGKGFAQRSNMKSHYRYNHKDKDPI